MAVTHGEPCVLDAPAATLAKGRMRDVDVASDSSGQSEPSAPNSMALVPVTPDDAVGVGVRRSARPHKKPRPYCKDASSVLPPAKPAKGLKPGFLG